MPVQVEQVVDGGIAFQKSLGLLDRFETPHTSFSDPSRLMRKLCPIVRILLCVVIGFRDQCSVCDAITAEFVRDDFSWQAA